MTCSRHALLATLVALVTGCATTTDGVTLEQNEVPAMEGSMLFFGVWNKHVTDVMTGLWIVDLAKSVEPRRIAYDTTYQPRPLARLGSDWLLLQTTPEQRMWVLEVDTGYRQVVEYEGETELLYARGSEAWFMCFEPRRSQSSRSFREWLDTRVGTLAKLKFDNDHASIEPFWERELARFFFVKDDGLWVATKGPEPGLWFVPLNGDAPREICRFDSAWNARDIELAFSPTGDKLALGITDHEHRKKRRGLAIVAVSSGESLYASDDALVPGYAAVLDFSNQRAYEPQWCTPDHLAYPTLPPGTRKPIDPEDHYYQFAEDVLDLDVWEMATAEVRLGAFQVADNNIVTHDSAKEEVSVLAREFSHNVFPAQPSPDGRWLAIAPKNGVEVFDAQTGRRETFTEGWVYCVGWLPQAAALPSQDVNVVTTLAELHNRMGQRVRLSGVAKHSQYGPCLELQDGGIVFLTEVSSHGPQELGRKLQLEGELYVWDRRAPRYGSHMGLRFEGSYALRAVKRLP